jgi:hypothetical protein
VDGTLIASLFIIIASSILFLYWFRYTCLLILQQKQEVGAPDYALRVTSTIRLSFPHLQQALQAAEGEEIGLDALHEGLSKDYRILTDLLQQFTGGDSIEHRILLLDYRVMQKWYTLTRGLNDATRARSALTEMSQILGYFASEIGESAAV